MLILEKFVIYEIENIKQTNSKPTLKIGLTLEEKNPRSSATALLKY